MAIPHPITALSAILPLVSWYQEHGRLPTEQECCAANGLPAHMTFYRHFPAYSTFSGRLSAALAQVRIVSTPVSACLPVGLPGEKYLPCLGPGCECRFWTTPEVRLCPTCRKHPRRRIDSVDEAETTAMPRAHLTRWGMVREEWSEEVSW
jgi:hypothetical protein